MVSSYDCYEATGLYPLFCRYDIQCCVRGYQKPRQTKFKTPEGVIGRVSSTHAPWDRLMIVLLWLRSGFSTKDLLAIVEIGGIKKYHRSMT